VGLGANLTRTLLAVLMAKVTPYGAGIVSYMRRYYNKLPSESKENSEIWLLIDGRLTAVLKQHTESKGLIVYDLS
jgi:hypothetical protein